MADTDEPEVSTLIDTKGRTVIPGKVRRWLELENPGEKVVWVRQGKDAAMVRRLRKEMVAPPR